eukprot:CAMPEP_0174267518 /NCGR_PEP_ID=MMETSP0439-20130205/33911_1 /TAXON_ID=0 /ORGANISM="Stereomyxa ramosa, Strain Chinc5" /LENGTH=355 /DNA_ID=CAMNT_0015355059 /DNA_START=65 /DNA_END=1128 /DNA_ORIENTATION=+
MDQLKSMFPDLDETVIRSIYEHSQKDVEKAIAALLEMNETELPQEERNRAKEEFFDEVLERACRMANEKKPLDLAEEVGLDIQTVMWEDNARNKDSVWGPCISDMTLQVKDRALPVIRHPNYEDLTWDVAIDKIPIVVGNEFDTQGRSQENNLYTITLKEYLEHFKMYLTKPEGWKGDRTSLYCPKRDSHVVMSAQACLLPVPKSEAAKFNVVIHNYQSRHRNPAVLAIVASSMGTSAQIVDGHGSDRSSLSGQPLFFNKNGQRANFLAERLSDTRKKSGDTNTDKEMTKEEQEKNVLMIIQVPLKQKTYRRGSFGLLEKQASGGCVEFNARSMSVAQEDEAVDMEDAQIGVGEG